MRLALAVVAAVGCLAFVACGGDDSGPRQTIGNITPVGTKAPTAEPSGGDATSAAAPSPVVPQLDEELTLFLAGQIAADLQPGESYAVDPVSIAQQVGTPPSCDNFQFDFSWQVTNPYPPDGVVLTWQLDRDSGPVEVANGAAGNQAIGCGVLHAVNGGATPIALQVSYLIGGK